MGIKGLFAKLFCRRANARSFEFRPSIEGLERENPRFAQMLKEWTTSQAIIESSAGQESEALDRFRKIILSRAFFALCLRRIDTTESHCEMMEAIDQIDTDKDLAISNLLSGAFHIIKLLSEHTGRQLLPLSVAENVNFLCAQLREVNRSAGSSYLILNRRPADTEASECDVICSEDKCDSIETTMLSKETIDRLDRHQMTWHCRKHREIS
jgi:hypothetical protein